MPKQVNVVFHDLTYAALTDFARSRETTVAEALRDSLSWAVWIQRQRLEGGKLLVETADGRVREVLLDGPLEDCPFGGSVGPLGQSWGSRLRCFLGFHDVEHKQEGASMWGVCRDCKRVVY